MSRIATAELICQHVAGYGGDSAHVAMPVLVDDALRMPEEMLEFATRQQLSATATPMYIFPLGLLAAYASDTEQEWMEQHRGCCSDGDA